MANKNIPQDSLLPHREIRDPSKSLSAVNPLQAMDNPHQLPRSTTTIKPMGIGQLLLILPLDLNPTPVSARSGITLLHQLIDTDFIASTHTRTRTNRNRRRQNRTQLRIMKMNQKNTSKITLNKDGLCFEIGYYQVKAREDQKLLLGMVPSLHSPRQPSHPYRLLPNY
jgi:hypothetical protein